MNTRTFKPSASALIPSRGNFQNIEYDKEQQSSITNPTGTIFPFLYLRLFWLVHVHQTALTKLAK